MQSFDATAAVQKSSVGSLGRGGQQSLGGAGSSFKDMKKQALKQKQEESLAAAEGGDEEMREVRQIFQ